MDIVQYVTGCDAQPVPTTSLLAYITCWPLHPKIPLDCDWAALIGIAGDLGLSTVQFGDLDGEWPVSREMMQLGQACKRETKKGITDSVALLNARASLSPPAKVLPGTTRRAARRTAEFNGARKPFYIYARRSRCPSHSYRRLESSRLCERTERRQRPSEASARTRSSARRARAVQSCSTDLQQRRPMRSSSHRQWLSGCVRWFPTFLVVVRLTGKHSPSAGRYIVEQLAQVEEAANGYGRQSYSSSRSQPHLLLL